MSKEFRACLQMLSMMYDSVHPDVDESGDLHLSSDGVTGGSSEPVETRLIETDENSDESISPEIDQSTVDLLLDFAATIGRCSEPAEKRLTETDVNSDESISPEIDGIAEGIIGRRSEPFEKQLTATDVNSKQCRLSIPKEYVAAAVSPLLKEDEDIRRGIPVKVYDGEWKEYSMTLMHWSNKIHVLKEGWMEFCTDHGFLALRDFVTLMVFRHRRSDGLCFQITSRRTDTVEPVKKRRNLNA
ncbi:Interactor of JAZ, putative isoform 1 [Hibiscus syriacus]|uniref:Interactor of JAZ, putative isoform 1 n=2 Tax=Hibiscus syriacus TaxID=106335 RepID=A0A6A3D466_HIBSY|nr:Interactor of JAZ, putative isoform 1 [Hibiscus syriacus]